MALENPLEVDGEWFDEVEAGRKTTEGRVFGPTKNYPPGFELTMVRKGQPHRRVETVVEETIYRKNLEDFLDHELERTAPHFVRRCSTRQGAANGARMAYNEIYVPRKGKDWDRVTGMAAIRFHLKQNAPK